MSSGNDIPVARFPLPDDWSPAGVVCAIVPIPNNPQYLETLVATVGLLSFSAQFARDDTKSGAAQVARTWRAALLTRPIIMLACEDVDMNCCDDPVVVVPPYPDSGTGAADAAASAIVNIYQGILGIAADCSLSRQEFIDTATAYMRVFDSSYSAPGPLGAVYDQWCPLSETAQEEYTEDCIYIDKVEDITPCYDAGGIMNDLNCLAEAVGEWLNETSDALMTALNQAAAALTGQGWQSASGGGGGGFGGGFGAECTADWCHTVHLMTETPPSGTHWTGVIYSGGYDDAGYKNLVDLAGEDPDVNRAWWRIAFDGIYEVSYMEIQFTSENTEHADYEVVRINTQHGTWQGQPFNPYEAFPYEHMIHNGGGTLAAARASLATAYVEFALLPYVNTISGLAQLVNVQSFKVCGTGLNPFS